MLPELSEEHSEAMIQGLPVAMQINSRTIELTFLSQESADTFRDRFLDCNELDEHEVRGRKFVVTNWTEWYVEIPVPTGDTQYNWLS